MRGPTCAWSMIRGNVADPAGQARAAATAPPPCWRSPGCAAWAGDLPQAVVLDPAAMVPAAGQGTVGVTVRADDDVSCAICWRRSRTRGRSAESTAERALLAALDGSCHTPIGGHARLLPGGELQLTGLVARPDGRSC